MQIQFDDTIAAIASAPGPGARGIIRVSGPDVRDCLNSIFVPNDPEHWRQARTAARHSGVFLLPSDALPQHRQLLPMAVYLWPTRRSYTGQTMAELHTIGSPPLLDAVMCELFGKGVRPARPGEFTLRAFLAGRVDLVQAEAVLGIIEAHDHEELELALKQLAGGISGKIADVRNTLIDLLADLEAGLDFADEDIEFVDRSALIDHLDTSHSLLDELLQQAGQRMRSCGRMRIVLAGLPNAGKSTLFNVLTGRTAALVSDIQGTTRDYLSAELDWNGVAVELIDTAGWKISWNKSPGDSVDTEVQAFRGEQVQHADLIVWCTACDSDTTALAANADQLGNLRRQQRPLLHIQTKCDAVAEIQHADLLHVSAHNGKGIPRLKQVSATLLTEDRQGNRQLLGMTASRCRESLASAFESISRAHHGAGLRAGEELLAIEIREALEHLGHVLGTVYTDDILDRIFSKFCIGK